MNMIRILADSTCDLSPELVARYGLTIIPLHVYLDDEEYLDGVNIFPAQIYEWSDACGRTPKTSAPSIEEVTAIYQPLLDAGDELIVFCISASMSASIEVCKLAAEELGAADRVHVVDSANLSTGIGLQMIEAAVMAEEGKSVEEILKAIAHYCPLVRASFVVDTLVYLHRGGRCSGLAAMAGSVLKLHPRIAVADGAMAPGKKYRGKIGRVMLNYAKDMEEDLLKAKPDRVFITHSPCDPADVAGVRAYLESLNYFNEILETNAGSVVSSHCGPGTLGVLFIAGE